MKIFIISAAVALASIASAAPAPAPATASTISRHFRLKTQVIEGMEGFNNQYLAAYHTGAGLNAPTFTKTASDGNIGYLNGTTANFAYGNNAFTILALQGPEDFYAGWAGVTMNIASVSGTSTNDPTSTSGFSIGPSGFFTHTKSNTEEFTGWRVCNWVHFTPELFYNTPVAPDGEIPSNCARVYLVPEYV